MIQPIRHFFVFLLLCIQAGPFFITAYLYLSQYQLKQTVYTRLKNEQLVCLTFSYEQAKNIESGGEIEVEGEMMDVQSVYRRQNEVFVYGYYDEAETALNEKLAAIMNGQSDKESEDLVIKIWHLFMMPCANQQGMQLQHFTVARSQPYIRFTLHLPNVYLPVATPPPLFV